jgi:hypothetical protein
MVAQVVVEESMVAASSEMVRGPWKIRSDNQVEGRGAAGD